MHFCVSATRGGSHDGFCCPRKIRTNWFMPAFVKSRFGASGRSEDDGTMECCFSRKKSRKDCLICAEVMMSILAWLQSSFLRARRFPNGNVVVPASSCSKSDHEPDQRGTTSHAAQLALCREAVRSDTQDFAGRLGDTGKRAHSLGVVLGLATVGVCR